MARLVLSFFGQFSATLDDNPVANVQSKRVQSLFAYLALEAHHAHPRARLAALLYG
jgi:DNA-binding SARP family transcriptional activator